MGYWPDFLLTEASALHKYAADLEALGTSSVELSHLAFDFQLDDLEGFQKQVYIDLTFKHCATTISIETFGASTLPAQTRYMTGQQQLLLVS